MEQLECAFQNYEWGKYNNESLVAKLVLNDDEVITKHNVPYAEV